MFQTSILGSVLLVAGLGRADVAPPRDYVETCTVAKQSGPGRTCISCSTYYGDPADKCAKEAGAGFSQACRTRGASTWKEVWCAGAGDAGAEVAHAEAGAAGDASMRTDGGSVDATPPVTAASDSAHDANAPAAVPKAGCQCAVSSSRGRDTHGFGLLLAACFGLLVTRRRKR